MCQVFYPDTQSTSQLLSDVLAELARRGHRITVLSGYPALHTGLSPAATEEWQGITIRRGGLRASVKKSMGLRALTFLSYSLHVVLRLLGAGGRCHVLAVTNPPFMPVLVWLVCRWRKQPFKLMLQDIYPEGLVAVGKIRGAGLIDRLWHAANRRAFRAAAEVWVLGRDMARLVEEQYAVPADMVRYVPHWSVVEVPHPQRPEQTRLWHQLELTGKFVVQYSGNMGLWHDMDTLIRAAALLQDDARIQFLFIGAGRRRAGAEQLARDLGVRNIRWLPYQPREALEDSLACCHAALISQRAGLEGVAVPCKLYGILASGRAVIAQAPAGSELALVLAEENCGKTVSPGDAEGMARCIAGLAAAPAETGALGANAHAAYQAKYTLAAGVAAFEAGLRDWPDSPEKRNHVA